MGIPVILSTDIYYDIADIDDHFDVSVVLKSPEFDVKGVILDNTLRKEKSQDGKKVLDQLMSLTKKYVPVVKGLECSPLKYFGDKVLNSPEQEGVSLVLDTLKESKDKVVLIGIGSMTDFAAAYARDPQLFRDKVDQLYIVAGFLHGKNPFLDDESIEYNVELDPIGFVSLMRSDLPITWLPCDVSRWIFPVSSYLSGSKNPLAEFLCKELLYWQLERTFARRMILKHSTDNRCYTWSGIDKLQSLSDVDRYRFHSQGCNLFSIPAFVLAANLPESVQGQMFSIQPIEVDFADTGKTERYKLVGVSNVKVVTNINCDALNQFVADRILS